MNVTKQEDMPHLPSTGDELAAEILRRVAVALAGAVPPSPDRIPTAPVTSPPAAAAGSPRSGAET